MQKTRIDLSNRVRVCAECGAVVEQCSCGSRRHPIVMSRMMYEIIQIQEDLDTPILEVGHADYVNAELVKAAGVAG